MFIYFFILTHCVNVTIAGVCAGWGDPHTVTFDGEYYSFQKNCTYVLIKEIVPRYNFTVFIDNENCDATGTITCAKALIVHYKNYEIILTQKRGTKTENLVGLVTAICVNCPNYLYVFKKMQDFVLYLSHFLLGLCQWESSVSDVHQ